MFEGIDCVPPTASDCGSLDNPLNGIVDISGTSFGDTATYRCNIGYQVVGEPVRTCEDTGLWSGTVPYCARTMNTSFSETLYLKLFYWLL